MARSSEQSPRTDRFDSVAGSTDPGALRRIGLQPHFAAVCAWTSGSLDVNDVPHFVELEGWLVELGSWERQTLKVWGNDERDSGLLAESIAYEIKCQQLVGLFEHGPMPAPTDLVGFLDGLVTTVAIGQALVDELQWSINRLIADGRLAEAKSQSGFRRKVVKALEQVQQRVGAAELEQAVRRAETMLTVRVVPEPTFAPLTLEEEIDAPSWASYAPESPADNPLPPWLAAEPEEPTPQRVAERRPSRVRPLLIALGLLVGVYAVVVSPRLARTPGPPQLTLENFSHIEAVEAIVARPPSLYVTIKDEAWRDRAVPRRVQLLSDVGRVASKAGYFGLHARTTDGVTVGQWLHKTGVALAGAGS